MRTCEYVERQIFQTKALADISQVTVDKEMYILIWGQAQIKRVQDVVLLSTQKEEEENTAQESAEMLLSERK